MIIVSNREVELRNKVTSKVELLNLIARLNRMMDELEKCRLRGLGKGLVDCRGLIEEGFPV